MKEGIFVGPQITQLFEDQDFSTKLNYTDKRAWMAFENVCRNFPGKEKSGKFQWNCAAANFTIQWGITCNWNFILCIPIWIFSPWKQGSLLWWTWRKFLHEISRIENRCSGKWSPNTLADYCWSLIRETPTGEARGKRRWSECLVIFFKIGCRI